MSLSHSNTVPKITKHVEQDIDILYNLYKHEEQENAEEFMITVCNHAKSIFDRENRNSPYYLIFMMKEVSPRMQKLCCTFAICPASFVNKGNEVIKDSLVWYCDKKKGIFKIVRSLCDLRRKTPFSEAGWTSDQNK